MESNICEFDGNEYDTHNRCVHSPIENISRKVLDMKRSISTLENNLHNIENLRKIEITYHINAEWETQEEEKQIQVEGVGKSSAIRIVIPSATK